VVEGTGLENRHTVYAVSRVRISPCPFALPVQLAGSKPLGRVSRRPTRLTPSLRSPRAGVALVSGWVAEWFKAHAWKACLRQKRNEGSNPSPSVCPASTYRVRRGVSFPGILAAAVRPCCPFVGTTKRTSSRFSEFPERDDRYGGRALPASSPRRRAGRPPAMSEGSSSRRDRLELFSGRSCVSVANRRRSECQ
jgi:hypothetical protein